MYLQAIASAFPPSQYTQREVWEHLCAHGRIGALGRRGRKILESILQGDSGIATRHFALSPEAVFLLDAQGLNEAFEREAPRLGVEALRKALASAGADPHEVDALFVCTCTGYLCPGVSSHVAGAMGLRPDCALLDVTGLGCGAAIPTLRAAFGHLAAHPEAVVAVLAVEVCSAATFLCEDRGVLVSACLFGDGASASIWRAQDAGGQWKAGGFRSLHLPSQREKIRFVNDGGRLRNQLDPCVPELAAEAVARLYEGCGRSPDAVIAHTGGRDVADAIEGRLPGHVLTATRTVLRRYGNISSPSVLVAAEHGMQQALPSDRHMWLTGFGAGFLAHSCDWTRSG
jgi:alkylresorcinol/alkylpyrone synthase